MPKSRFPVEMLLLFVGSTAQNCPSGWNEVPGLGCLSGPGQSPAVPYPAAEEFCSAQGAIMVEVLTEEIQDGMAAILEGTGSSASFWIGLTDVNSEGIFYWSHSQELANFTAWYTGQPDGGTNENCVGISPFTEYQWVDLPCQAFNEPLCFLPVRTCRQDYQYIASADKCMKFYPSFFNGISMNHDSAVEFCKDEGGTLAEIRNQAIAQEIKLYSQCVGNWIGLGDEAEEGVYRWESDSSVAVFQDWFTGLGNPFVPPQPDSGRIGNCVVTNWDAAYQWCDINCDHSTTFEPLCQIEPDIIQS